MKTEKSMLKIILTNPMYSNSHYYVINKRNSEILHIFLTKFLKSSPFHFRLASFKGYSEITSVITTLVRKQVKTTCLPHICCRKGDHFAGPGGVGCCLKFRKWIVHEEVMPDKAGETFLKGAPGGTRRTALPCGLASPSFRWWRD